MTGGGSRSRIIALKSVEDIVCWLEIGDAGNSHGRWHLDQIVIVCCFVWNPSNVTNQSLTFTTGRQRETWHVADCIAIIQAIYNRGSRQDAHNLLCGWAGYVDVVLCGWCCCVVLFVWCCSIHDVIVVYFSLTFWAFSCPQGLERSLMHCIVFTALLPAAQK